MTRPARIAAILGGVLVLLLLFLLLVPLLFKDRIAERVKIAINRNLNARVDWQDLGLGFFRDFPNLSLSLDGLTAVGVGRFEGDTLAAVRSLRVSLSLPSVIGNLTAGQPIVVRSVTLDEPRLRLLALEDGTANWDITKKTPETPEQQASKPFAVSLRQFDINDASVAFENRQAKLTALVRGFSQSLSGDFSQRLVAVKTKADADTVSVTFAGIPYLTRVALGLTADVEADLARKLYTLKTTELRLNDLRLGVTGSASTAGANTALDLAFKAPSASFRSILSLVPAVYTHDFGKIKTAGTIAVDGRVKGEYGDKAFPSLAINTRVDNAAFQYPDLPLPARDINVTLAVTNPGGSADSTVVRLDRFHLRMGQNPIDARMTLRTPISDPDVDARVAGKVDLADVRRTVKLDNVKQLSGTVSADALVRTRLSYLDKKQYERVNASGTVDVAGVTVKTDSLPQPLAIRQMSLRLAPERAELRSFQGALGSSDVEATGSIENLLGFALRSDVLRGTATVKSRRFNLDEWKSGDSESQIIPVPPRIDFGLDASAGELVYDNLRMTNARGRLRVKDRRITLEDFRMNTLGGEIGVNGYYDTKDLAKPLFDVGFRMTKVDIPSAFKAFATVQALAPVAKYAIGNVTTDFRLNGALGKNMLPLFPGLSGGGTLLTTQVGLHDFPAMNKIVDVTKLNFLNNPTLKALKAAFQINGGRLAVQPFDVKVGNTTMTIAGSNGFDQSLAYTLGLKVPRSMLGGAANQAITSLASQAGKVGLNLAAAPEIGLGIQLGGTVTNPSVKADVKSAASSVAETATNAVKAAATEKVSAAATKLVQEAEQRAAGIRQEAQSLADKVTQEGYAQADALTSKAGSNPLAQIAAKPAADKLRKSSDDKAAGIISEANKRADALVAEARQKAGGK